MEAVVCKPVDQQEWVRILRRVQMTPGTKYLGLMMSTYANFDGSRVFPGVKKLALVMCVSEKTAKRALAELRALGMVERVKQGNRHNGDADEYRLTVPVDLLNRPMLDPDEQVMSGGHQ
ncbi:helix-turn-helix domain-containing protein [Nocardia nova]|uniref:helix-turn-helix domain-containing protein n=1 Tax=Nocardia nova TaxID=37330 RepID=UPI0037982839